MIYPKQYSVYLRGTILLAGLRLRVWRLGTRNFLRFIRSSSNKHPPENVFLRGEEAS